MCIVRWPIADRSFLFPPNSVTENRVNAFKKLSGRIEQPSRPAKQGVCVNCQQLIKKENQKILPGVSCHFCEKHVCLFCVQRCSTCEFDFCRFCSDQLYDREKDTYKCLSC